MDSTFLSPVPCGFWVCTLGCSAASYLVMRYRPEHKTEIHRKIVKDASRRVRTEGLKGAAVGAVMRDTGLTHGGFYKHFESKDELLVGSLREASREMGGAWVRPAERPPAAARW